MQFKKTKEKKTKHAAAEWRPSSAQMLHYFIRFSPNRRCDIISLSTLRDPQSHSALQQHTDNCLCLFILFYFQLQNAEWFAPSLHPVLFLKALSHTQTHTHTECHAIQELYPWVHPEAPLLLRCNSPQFSCRLLHKSDLISNFLGYFLLTFQLNSDFLEVAWEKWGQLLNHLIL